MDPYTAKSLFAANSPSEQVNITTPQIQSYEEQRMRGTASRRTRDGILAASGAALMLAVLLVVQSFVGSGLLSTKTVTVIVTTSDAYEQVQNAYASHMTVLSTRNPSAAVSGYESNATVEWTGVVAGGLTGSYSGAADIKILLGSF